LYRSASLTIIVFLSSVLFGAEPVRAFDPLAWLGAKPTTEAGERGPEVGADASNYRTALDAPDASSELKAMLAASSRLMSQDTTPTDSLPALLAIARDDQKRLIGALYESGRYGGAVAITIAGQALDALDSADIDFAGEPIEVVISVTPGPLFHFGEITVGLARDVPNGAPSDAATYGLAPGNVAKSPTILNAVERLVEDWRVAGYPLTRLVSKRVIADHANQTVKVAIEIDPGEQAVLGWLTVSGTSTLSTSKILRHSGLRPGRRYSPAELADAGERLRKLDAVESVRIVEGQRTDATGGLPITLDVSEQKKRFIGANVSASTVDGAELQAYWGHRNMFGNAETFRVEGGVSRIGRGGLPALQYYSRMSLRAPGVWDANTDFVSELGLIKETPETYDSSAVTAKVGLARQFDAARSGSAYLAASISRETDAVATSDYAVLSAPLRYAQDTTNSRLDPTVGWRGTIGVEPAYDFAQSAAYVVTRGDISTYRAVDPDERLVLAGLVGIASIAGATLSSVQASRRLYAGGGGSVRGFEFRSLGVERDGAVMGGFGLLRGSLEARWRVTPSIGLVPFVDFATVSDEPWPSFSELHVGAGLGVRYYTALGPLRLDVAVPLAEHSDAPDFAFYVGLGQSF
jgi:translocation and assembly module TamA